MTKALQTQQNSGKFSLVPTTFAEAMRFAELIAASDLAPKDYRGKPANVIVAVQMGANVGLDPMQAIQNISVINGRASLWGDAMLAVCTMHRAWRGIEETYDRSTGVSKCVVRRANCVPVERTFSVDDAKVACLWGKSGPWTSYPKRMLQMRARGFALRDSFPDALRGLSSAEEVSDYTVDATTGEIVDRPVDYVDAETVETLEADITPPPELDVVLGVIQAATNAEDLAEAGKLTRRLSGEERAQAVAAGMEKKAELEAFAKAQQTAHETELAAATTEDGVIDGEWA